MFSKHMQTYKKPSLATLSTVKYLTTYDSVLLKRILYFRKSVDNFADYIIDTCID